VAENELSCLSQFTAPRSTRRKAETSRTSHITLILALSVNVHRMDIGDEIENTPFPAPAKHAAGLVNGIHTDVSSVYFADKILITVSQAGRLSQWVCSPWHLLLELVNILTSLSADSCAALLCTLGLDRYSSGIHKRRHVTTGALNSQNASWSRRGAA
jgi:hypothetical protein